MTSGWGVVGAVGVRAARLAALLRLINTYSGDR